MVIVLEWARMIDSLKAEPAVAALSRKGKI